MTDHPRRRAARHRAPLRGAHALRKATGKAATIIMAITTILRLVDLARVLGNWLL